MHKQDKIVELRATIIELKLSNPYDRTIPQLNQQLDKLIQDVQLRPTEEA